MFKRLAIIPVVTAVVLAQAPSSLIPTGISDGCASYLKDLNSNTEFKGCTSAVSGAASTFGNAQNATAAQVTSALGKLCASSVETACPDDLVGSIIAKFYTACSPELTSKPNKDVIQIYDGLFTLLPFRKAVCALDDGGNYCSAQAKLPPSMSVTDLQQVLSSPSSGNSAALVPNATTISTTNLPFLFLDPSLPTSSLCNVCTRKIINAYVNFEGNVQYAPGLSQSLYLKNQAALYAGVKEKCGDSFLLGTGVVKAAGGLAGGTLGGSNGAVQLSGFTGGLVATSMSVIALVVSSVL